MGIPRPPKPAKYMAGLLSSQPQLLEQVETELAAFLGEVEHRSETLAWNVSQYYDQEMGANLLRRFVSFTPLHSPGKLAEFKLRTQQIENLYRASGDLGSARTLNVDPGYLDAFKLVLASTKNASQRIYLDSGIYAEATLLYYDGSFHGMPYTYRDYLWPQTQQFLATLRSTYLQQLRQLP